MVQMELIALDHNLDEIIAARPVAGYLHRNPIERCEGKLKLNVDCGKALFFLRFPKKVCIYCGSSKNVTTSVNSYTKCNKKKCKKDKNVLKTKRKTVLAADLAPACKKKK